MTTTCLPPHVDRGDRQVTLLHLVGEREVLHREVDAAQLTAGDRQVAGDGGTGRDDDRVVAAAELGGVDVLADLHLRTELGAFQAHLLDAAVDVRLLHLELGDAVAQQATDAVRALVDGDGVVSPGQLLGGGESRRARADDRDGLAGKALGRLRVTSPLSHALSMMETSTFLMVTAYWLMPSTHADSQGAGQSRPVNSGKLFVACSRSEAAVQSPR